MTHLHPPSTELSLRSGLRDGLPQQSRADRLRRYIAALECHDWQFEAIEDHFSYVRAKAAHQALRAERQSIDPDGSIWNLHCPSRFTVSTQ